jgi:hypothetical protein
LGLSRIQDFLRGTDRISIRAVATEEDLRNVPGVVGPR